MDRGRTNASVLTGLALAVIVSTVSGGLLLDLTAAPHDLDNADFDLSVYSDGTVELTHRGGSPLDVQEVRIHVAVDGQALTHQPPVPFFATAGFRGGPTGVFNPAADARWRVGERASFRVASTNAPAIGDGDRVRVRIFLDGSHLWSGTSVVGSDTQ